MNNFPTITIIGRTNVGKSTLFNILIKNRNYSLVSNIKKFTIDRKYGYISINNYNFKIIDTGNLICVKNKIDLESRRQTIIAIKESDIILFIVDGKTGVMNEDKEIAKEIRKYNKKTLVIVNKNDNFKKKYIINDFYIFGIKKILSISAINKIGIKKLLIWIILLSKFDIIKCEKIINNKYLFKKYFKNKIILKNKKNNLKNKKKKLKKKIIISIIGKPNVGKSTLLNSILNKNRIIVNKISGTTRDSIDVEIIKKKRKYIFIDTAGIKKKNKLNNKIEKFSINKTLKSIKKSNVLLLVFDGFLGICDEDLSILNLVIKYGKSLIILINKWDKLYFKEKKKIKNYIHNKLKFINFIKIYFISALYDKKIYNFLFKSIYNSYLNSTKKINTSLLNNILKKAINNYQPPIINKKKKIIKKIKLKYAHIGGMNPPLIIIHGLKVDFIKKTYKNYLMNFFRRYINFKGTPIKIKFNKIINPYIKYK